MFETTPVTDAKPTRSLWFRGVAVFAFLLCVNLLAGFVAVRLHYESLWNVQVKFSEYALPLPFCWGLAHVPSMLLCGIALFFLPTWSDRGIRNFRIICLSLFFLLLLEGDRQIPFLLFPKVDAPVAFLFSCVVAPPNRRDNPFLVAALKLSAIFCLLLLGFYSYVFWSHRTPALATTQYVDGAFELRSIEIHNDYRQSMVFHVELKKNLETDQACTLAQMLADAVLVDYSFDPTYRKTIEVAYNPATQAPDFKAYPLGEIDLSSERKATDGRYNCYLRYK